MSILATVREFDNRDETITPRNIAPKGSLTTNDLERIAPSIFASQPRQGASDRYHFIPTTEVIGMLAEQNFYPVRAKQTISRDEDRRGFAKHVLRFRRPEYFEIGLNHEAPELVLTNSHDRSSAYQIMAGIFRQVCGNGLTVQSSDFGSVSVKHLGGVDFRHHVIDATYRVIEATPKILAQVDRWKSIELNPHHQLAFATAARELRDNAVFPSHELLRTRRIADDKNDLWTTLNRVQENLIKGGLRGRNPNGRVTRTRPIKAIDADIKTNRALWRLAEEIAKLY